MVKVILWTALATVALLAALKLLVMWAEPRLAFYPIKGLSATPVDFGLPFRELKIETSDGETLTAWEIRKGEPRAELVFFHGNAGNLSRWLPLLAEMFEEGYSVTALDYRGYGDSSGTPSESGISLDIEAFLEVFWSQVHRDGLKTVYWGRSLGGPFAAFATRAREADGLILEATFPSKASLIEGMPLFRALQPFSSYRFPTLELLSGRRCPVLVIHGDQDTIVPYPQGEKLFSGLAEPKEFLTIPGGHHGNLGFVDPAAYWGSIHEFIKGLGSKATDEN